MKFIWLVVIMSSVTLAEDGFGYEVIMTALENVQSNGISLDRDLRAVATNVDQMLDDQCSSKSTVQNLYELMEQDLRSVAMKLDTLVDVTRTFGAKINQLIDWTSRFDPSRCPENAGNGIYGLNPLSSSISSFSVYCENGWIVIHRRFNGCLDFNRTWIPFKHGFGDVQGEHWLGLEKIHQITRVGSYELKVVLKSFDDVEKTAKYEGFRIGSENEHYQLSLRKFVEGDAGDSLMYHNDMKFPTSDRDNDKAKGTCAVSFKSGWWFKSCYQSNLNGYYEKGKDSSMSWSEFNKNHDCLKEARMLIRQK